jgi:spore germination protein GerM
MLIYLPNGSTSRLLVGVERIVPQGMADDPYTVLGELMRGPAAADRADVYPAMPAGITIDDVESVYIAGSMMALNFKGAIHEKLRGISEDNEFAMVFAIVNTLTNFEGIRSVQFLVEGERVGYLGGGMINVVDPIIKNPGIIR